MRTLRWAVLLLGLWPELGGVAEPSGPENEPPGPVAPARQWRYLARLDASGLALLPRVGLGVEEGLAQLDLTLILDGGADLGLNLGAPVRLLLGRSGMARASSALPRPVATCRRAPCGEPPVLHRSSRAPWPADHGGRSR
jgi:hypothetical protein